MTITREVCQKMTIDDQGGAMMTSYLNSLLSICLSLTVLPECSQALSLTDRINNPGLTSSQTGFKPDLGVYNSL